MNSRTAALTLALVFAVVQSISLAECCCGSQCSMLAPDSISSESTECCEIPTQTSWPASRNACVHVAPSDQIVLELCDLPAASVEAGAARLESAPTPDRSNVIDSNFDDSDPHRYLRLGVLRL